jgi:hypothetical protein
MQLKLGNRTCTSLSLGMCVTDGRLQDDRRTSCFYRYLYHIFVLKPLSTEPFLNTFSLKKYIHMLEKRGLVLSDL